MNNFKQLTLQTKTANNLNNIECFETIDKKILNKLLKSNILRQDLRYKNIFEPEKD